MKNFKLTLVALTTMLFTSCDKEVKNDNKEVVPPKYKGVMVSTSPDKVDFENKNAIFDLTFNTESNTATIVMNEISFTDKMPAQTMEMKNVPYTYKDGKLAIGAAETIPNAGGKPYDKYKITRLQSELTKDSMMLEFSCIEYAVTYKAALTEGELPVTTNTVATEQSFTGDLSMKRGEAPATDSKGITFSTVMYDKIGKMNITMNGIKFAPMMPDMPMTLKWVNFTKEGDDINFSGMVFTPFVGDKANYRSTFTNVAGAIKSGVLTMSMKSSGFDMNYSGSVK